MEREESRFTNFNKWNPTILYIMFLARHGCYTKDKFLRSLNQKDFDDMDKAKVTPSDLIDYTNPRGAAPEDDQVIYALQKYFKNKPILFITGNFMSEETANEILELVDNIKTFAEKMGERYGVSEIEDIIKTETGSLKDEIEVEYEAFVRCEEKKIFKLSDKIKYEFSFKELSGNLLD